MLVTLEHKIHVYYPGWYGRCVGATLQLAEVGTHTPHAPSRMDLDFKNSMPLHSNATCLWSQSEAMHIQVIAATHE